MTDIRAISRWMIVIGLVMLVPIIPFLSFGQSLQGRIEGWFDGSLSAPGTAVATIGVLASDIFLPVPSSFVSTAAGARLGVACGTAVSWFGLTLGATLGFALARWFGPRFARRLAGRDELARMEMLGTRIGPPMLVLTRALPVLAETTVLLAGTLGLSWRQFLPATALANLGLALAYSLLGHWAAGQDELVAALVASIAIPLLAARLAHRGLRTSPAGDRTQETVTEIG